MHITKEQSVVFWQMKAFAIFTVFFAHMPGHAIGDSSWMVKSFNVIGMIGVPLFMLLSGFFYKGRQSSILKSIKRLFVPLIIWGTVCYILHIIKTPTETPFVDWAKFVGGSKSIFYFVPMLFCCMLLSRWINNWLLLIIGLISQTLTSYTDIFPYNDVWTLMLNPLNFIPYFVLGRLFRQYQVLNYYCRWWSVISAFILAAFLSFTEPQYHYPYTFIFTISSFFFIYYAFSLFISNNLISIGKISFVLYLSHIQIAGAIQALFTPLWGTYIEPLKVLVAFLLASVFCFAIKYVLNKLSLEVIEEYLGYR